MTRTFLKAVVCCLVLASASAALAQSVEIKTQSGTRWRGQVSDQVTVRLKEHSVVEEISGRLLQVADLYIVVKGEVAGEIKDKVIFRADIVSMSSQSEGAKQPDRTTVKTNDRGATSTQTAAAASPNSTGPGVFFLPLTGMVGLEFRHEEMEAIAKEADKYGPGQIIVFEIDSGGGSAAEMEKIHETLTEIKKRHRLVAWIKAAISAACATSVHCDEIYFTTEGHAGSMTAFAGGVSLKGAELDQWMKKAGDWMEQGGRYRGIGPVMIHAPLELSYDKDPVTGKVTWHDDLSGEFILSRSGENLTFNSTNAVHCGFADGIADTKEDLAKLLDLPAWKEASDYGEKLHKDWIATVERAQEEIQRMSARLSYYKQGSGDSIEVLGYRVSVMKQLVSWWDRAPNVCQMSGIPPKETLEREITEIQHQIANLRRAQALTRPSLV